MKHWTHNNAVMDDELYTMTTDILVDFVAKRIDEGGFTDIPPIMFVASPPDGDDDNISPDLMMFIISELDQDTKHQTLAELGATVAKADIQIAASFFVFEAWIRILEGDAIRDGADLKMLPDRKEIVSICGLDITNQYRSAIIHLRRDPDTNVITVGEIERHYDNGEGGPLAMHSDLMTSYMLGYTNMLHIQAFGVPVDPDDPYKMLPKKG